MTKQKSVLIITHSCDPRSIFEERGWKVSHVTSQRGVLDAAIEHHHAEPFDLVVFTGGADLNPALYDEKPAGAIGWSDARDQLEVASYHSFVGKVPMAGICRGAQLLTVMNGGKLEQHRSGHSGDHLVKYILKNKVFTNRLRECHHQCLLPGGKNEVDYHVLGRDVRDENIEIVFFPRFKQLCFQGHPEWGHPETEGLFFELLEEHLGL